MVPDAIKDPMMSWPWAFNELTLSGLPERRRCSNCFGMCVEYRTLANWVHMLTTACKAIFRRPARQRSATKTGSPKLFDLEQRDGGFTLSWVSERVRTWAYVAHRQDWVSDPEE